MICERCRKKKASVIHREARSGRLFVRHLCAECTEILEATGELCDISAVLPPYMAPMIEDEGGCLPFFLPPGDLSAGGSEGMGKVKGTAVKCPLCGMNAAELVAAGRPGCPQCYAVFSELLASALLTLRGEGIHKGRLPAAVRRRRELSVRLSALRTSLREAVETEQFERAATLRDEIRALESGGVA